MTAPQSTHETLAVTVALLDQGGRIDRLSCALTIAGTASVLAIVLLGAEMPVPTALLAASVVCGMAELYFAIRVGFDAALFRRLADMPNAPDLAALDTALGNLGLLPSAKTGRSLEQRTAGACRLFRWQAGLLAYRSRSSCLARSAQRYRKITT